MEPAFPHLVQGCQRMGESEHYSGLTIRDWFAGHVLSQLLADAPDDTPITSVAAKCYRMADAMLVERNKESTNA